MSSPARIHDPLFHFETHFPDRLSRLHLNPELAHFQSHQSSIRRPRRQRSSRQGQRYKTQPVTFDEIQEVDEETVAEQIAPENLMGQFQAFSRSMDGLVPKFTGEETGGGIIIKEKDALGSSARTVDVSANERTDVRLQSVAEETNKENEPQTARGAISIPAGGNNQPRPNRRARMTAKAKRRQMMAEAHEHCGTDGGGEVET